MRLIDAEQCPCNDCISPLGDSRGCSIFPCREFNEWYVNTIYDVDKIANKIEEQIDGSIDYVDDDDGYYLGLDDGFRICADIVRKGVE